MYTVYDPENIVVRVLNIIVNHDNSDKIEIYIHNLNFDGIIIINELSKNLINFELISEKTNIYCIYVNYCNKKIIFKCSYKIIPLSLKILGEMENFHKTNFPYSFVNENNLYYVGETPKFEF